MGTQGQKQPNDQVAAQSTSDLNSHKKTLLLGVAHPWDEWNKPNSSTLFTLSFFFLDATLGRVRKASRASFLSWHHCLILLQSIYHITMLHYPDLDTHGNGYVYLIHIRDKCRPEPILRNGINLSLDSSLPKYYLRSWAAGQVWAWLVFTCGQNTIEMQEKK